MVNIIKKIQNKHKICKKNKKSKKEQIEHKILMKIHCRTICKTKQEKAKKENPVPNRQQIII